MTTSMTGSNMNRGRTGLSSGQTMTGGNVIPKGYSQGQLQQFTPEMMDLFKQMFSHASPDSYLSKLSSGDESMFEQLEAPAMRQFQGLQGQIASRFSGQAPGAMSSRGGSGFRNTMNQATSDFAQDLQSKRMGLQQNAITSLRDMASMLLGQKPYEQFLKKKEMPFWKQLILGINEKGAEAAADIGKYYATGGA